MSVALCFFFFGYLIIKREKERKKETNKKLSTEKLSNTWTCYRVVHSVMCTCRLFHLSHYSTPRTPITIILLVSAKHET